MKKYIEKKKDAKTALTVWWYVCLTDEDEIKSIILWFVCHLHPKETSDSVSIFQFLEVLVFCIVPLRLILNHHTAAVICAIPHSVWRDELLDSGRVHLCFGGFGSFTTFWLLPNHNCDDEDVPHHGTGAIKGRYCITLSQYSLLYNQQMLPISCFWQLLK